MQDPNADTEWNDALRRHGILGPKQDVEITEQDIVALAESTIEAKTRGKSYDEMDDDELDELEDDLDEEDERAFEAYRAQRMAQLRDDQRAARFGSVTEISKADWVTEVNKAGEGVWVVVEVYKPGVPVCKLLAGHLQVLASRYPAVKFVRSDASACFEKAYPERNLPTMFLYRDGEMQQSWVGPACGALNTTQADLEWRLHERGVVKSQLTENPRRGVTDVMAGAVRTDNDDNDW